MYEIIVTDEAKKQLAELTVAILERIGAALERVKVRPHAFVKRMHNSKYYRLRVDNYRVILDVLDTQLIIYVVKVAHRSTIYKIGKI